MKLIILLSILISKIRAWHVIFEIYNRFNIFGFYRSYTINVVSDLGGAADAYCNTYSTDQLRCDARTPKKSHQGGYTVNNLECLASNCHFIINTANINFNIEVNCEKGFDMNPSKGVETKRDYCTFVRNFKLFEDGKVEYADESTYL
ncbi:hypothetical protein CONCODRAFT_4359 [Conidiobolus coronatus NRRL 28638]|uniref:Cyanovirin-N domain-containing protein n=1 Tax=Conidiobolus coronatus (strain ATCC 28846 / CBS 209.66 / NRRL 28638) TaxID=796925 RepID=A0A137PCM7_CONC2|nr:hypothetical protein CONCODRAFT_4359 [Conidiobolus coronatus NRRL 28638]|eukprot:KXN72754.1 hypothetical protein CONCODRAFT_4359 [Conidiobolus coronatus NRRL 28638]